ncbi:MAG: hypothetical protein QNJ18_16740 [Xenococcaceae cyanobacterium MO_167.B52]|nr:hypothetical protein [Xenococcaceae cyanobacterium MO_167.B52]
MQALVKVTPQKSAQKTVSSYLTVMDGDKQKLYSLKEFSMQYKSYKQFDPKYTKSIYFSKDIFVEGFDYLNLIIGECWISFLSWHDVLLAGSQALLMRSKGVRDEKIIDTLSRLYP